MNPVLLAALAASMLPFALPAQKLAMSDGSERQVVILDVGHLLPETRGVALPVIPQAGRSAAVLPTSLQNVASFVRTFAMPLDEPGADLQPLGDRHLVALGSAVQVAAAERLVAHSGKVLDRQYQIDLRMCEVPAEMFDQHVAPLLPQPAGEQLAVHTAPRTAVLATDAVRPLQKVLGKSDRVKFTQFPQIVAEGLRNAKLRVGKQLGYIRDFDMQPANGTWIANPIMEVVFDGYDVDVVCAETRNGIVGVQMQMVDQVIEQPIAEVTTTIPGSTMEVKVQVPRITGCRASQTVEMADGATAILAARKSDGSWLVSLMTPMTIRSAPAQLARPK